MPKGHDGEKRPSARAISRWETDGGATKRLPSKLPDYPIALSVTIMREATGQKPKGTKLR